MTKTWKIVITILLVLVILGVGYVAYSYYDKEAKRSNEVETLKKEITDLESDIEKEKSLTTSDAGCDHGLTSDEEEIIADWDTYTSSSYNYSIKYPSDWTLNISNPMRVNIRDAGADGEGSLTIYSAEAAIMGFAEYTIENEEDFEIDCQTEKLINFSYDSDGDTSGRVQVASFYNGSIQYTTMFSYQYLGASEAGDMQGLGRLILKTMELN